jgi:hypothetical protein
MAIAVRYVLPLVLCQLVVPVVTDFSREVTVTGARRLEMEDASAQGAMVNSTHPCRLIGLLFYLFVYILFFCGVEGLGLGFKCLFTYYLDCFPP